MQKAKEKQMLNERAKQRASMRTKRYTYDFKGQIMYLNKFQKDKLPPSQYKARFSLSIFL